MWSDAFMSPLHWGASVASKHEDVFLYLQHDSFPSFSEFCPRVPINAGCFLSLIFHWHILFPRNPLDPCCPDGREGRSEVQPCCHSPCSHCRAHPGAGLRSHRHGELRGRRWDPGACCKLIIKPSHPQLLWLSFVGCACVSVHFLEFSCVMEVNL